MNNSTSAARPRYPNSRYKTAVCLRENVTGFIQDFGLERCGLLTLVFPPAVRWKHADESVAKAQRTVLDRLFKAWISVVETHKDGRPHFHFLVAGDEDLAAGFDWEARNLAKDIHQHARSQHREMTAAERALHRRWIRESTAEASALRAVWEQVRPKLRNYGFAPQHPGTLEPVFSAVAIGKYLSKSFGDCALPRPAELKGARLVRYSQAVNRRAYQRFAGNGQTGQLRRRQIARIAVVLGVNDGGFAPLYGPRWYHRLMEMVEYMRLASGRDDGEPRWSDELIRQAAETYLSRA